MTSPHIEEAIDKVEKALNSVLLHHDTDCQYWYITLTREALATLPTIRAELANRDHIVEANEMVTPAENATGTQECMGLNEEILNRIWREDGKPMSFQRLKWIVTEYIANARPQEAEAGKELDILVDGLLAADSELTDYAQMMFIRGGKPPHWPVKAIVDALAIARRHAEIRERRGT